MRYFLLMDPEKRKCGQAPTLVRLSGPDGEINKPCI